MEEKTGKEKDGKIRAQRAIYRNVLGGYLHGSMDGNVHLTPKGLDVIAPILDHLGWPRNPRSDFKKKYQKDCD